MGLARILDRQPVRGGDLPRRREPDGRRPQASRPGARQPAGVARTIALVAYHGLLDPGSLAVLPYDSGCRWTDGRLRQPDGRGRSPLRLRADERPDVGASARGD